MARLVRNVIRCRTCDDVIESRRTHEHVTCSCGKVSVDGGQEYGKRSFPENPPDQWYEELSEYETEESKWQRNLTQASRKTIG